MGRSGHKTVAVENRFFTSPETERQLTWNLVGSIEVTCRPTRGLRWPCIAPPISRQVRVSWLFSSRKSSYRGFSIRIISASFWSTSHFDTSYELSSHLTFLSGEKIQNRFSTWLLGQPSWISNQNGFSYFWYFLSSFESIGLSVQTTKFKIDFKDGNFGCNIAFLIWTILAIFDLQVTQVLLIISQLAFGSGQGQNSFPRWWLPWISYWNNFWHFLSTITLMLSTKFRVNWPFGSEAKKNEFQDGSHLGFRSDRLQLFFYFLFVLRPFKNTSLIYSRLV